ncbi:MAG: metal ABC transporter substrate-binding protein [Thermodesulfobacteriota bacterium]
MKFCNRFISFVFIAISFLFLLIFMSSRVALAKVQIVTSVPNFAAIAQEIGGDKVEVKSIAKGYQDPHFVDAKPIFIRDLNRADLLIYQGLDLEIGWLPVLITGSRNSKITSLSSPGRLDASTSISNILEVPTTRVDRSMGDIHSFGNPHYTLDPRNGILVARGIAARLMQIDPENSTFFEENYKDFSRRLNEKIKEWDRELAPYKGTEVVTYHKSWVYFTNWAGFKEVGWIEPKPGIPPSPSHVANLIKNMVLMNVKLVIAESYYPQKTARIIAEKTGSEFLVLPSSVGATEEVRTYIDLFDTIVSEITTASKKINKVDSA